jgi:hypothetical protein
MRQRGNAATRLGPPFAAVGLAGGALAAEAPTPPPTTLRPELLPSLYDYLNASAVDCPLSYADRRRA